MKATNELQFIGRVGKGGAKVVTESKNPFISFSLCELNGRNQERNVWLEVTQNFKENPPAVVDRIRQGAIVLVKGTPYAKIRSSENGSYPQLAMFADNIEVLFDALND